MSDRNTTLGPPPYLAYAGSRLDRAAERRSDADFVARAFARPDARTYVISGERIVLAQKNGKLDPLFTPADAAKLGPAPETILIGLDGEAAHFAHALATADAAKLENGADFLVVRSAHCRTEGAGQRGPSRPHRRRQGADGLARPAPLLLQLRRTDAKFRGRLAARLPGLQGTAFPAHRSVRDHARDRPGPLPARPLSAISPAICGRALPDSSSPARSIEDAVRRETFEEAGVTVGRVRLFRLPALAVSDVADDRLPCRGERF